MKAFAYTVVALCVAVLIETVLPDRAVFHSGWYNVALLALIVALVLYARRALRSTEGPQTAALVAIALGAGILGFAGIVNGLFAPDPRTFVGAPGQEIALAEMGGVLAFPSIADSTTPELVRSHTPVVPVSRERYLGSFILRPIPRTVVRVDAYDANGAHLTVTQPTGSVFLSPVLMMESTQEISGLDLPFDSFALPAAHRIVKAVLFSAQQIAALRGVTGTPAPAVLFAVDDQADRPLPHAIRLARSGETIQAGGVRLRGVIATYPAVDVIAAPSLPAVIAGLVLVVGGAFLFLQQGARTRFRS